MHADMMIPRIGEWVKRHRGRLWTALCLALSAWSAYNLGLIHASRGARPLQDAAVFRVREGNVPQSGTRSPERSGRGSEQGSTKPAVDRTDTRVVVSKSSSSKKYHHAWCPGAKQIKEANRIWFPSAQAAQAAGYALAGNCTP